MGLDVTDVGLKDKSSTHELKKHAATIHCSNSLSLLQRKISNALLYHAYKELLLKEEHEINIKQLCRLISYNGNNHAAIKDALKGLLSTVIEWNVVCDTTGIEDWTASSILASVSLRGPVCLYAYSPRMKQLLHSPSMFGKINLFIQSRFKSSYGLALYENCIRYRSLPYTKWFDFETFRKLMGVPDDKYTIFRDFKRRVLDKSVEEVNTYSDLIVESEICKEGRQIIKVRFSLKERAKKTRLGVKSSLVEMDEDSSSTLKGKLIKDFGLSHIQVQQVFSEYEMDFILEKISIIETSKNYQLGKVQNVAGYLLSALKNNYQLGKGSLSHHLEQEIQEQHRLELCKEIKRQVEHIREEYQVYREQLVDTEIALLSNHEKMVLLDKFYRYAEEPINTILRLQKNKYTRETVLNSPQIKAQLRQFAYQEFSLEKDMKLSFEKFIETLPTAKKELWQKYQDIKQQEVVLEN